MAASEGVNLEWAIVKFGQGEDVKKLKKQYSSRIIEQAFKSIKNIENKIGKSYKIFHSDEEHIYAQPEPKTDIVIYAKNKKYFVSVKMEGGIQLASGQGESTAEMFRETGEAVFSGNRKKLSEVESLANIISQMPTKLLAPQNLERILKEANPNVLKEFTKAGKILSDKNANVWLETAKPKLLKDIQTFIKENPTFYTEIIREALSGERTLKRFKGAVATHVLSPAGFYKIDDNYVLNVKNKIKMDIRAKSRSGITSIAFRIETRGSI